MRLRCSARHSRCLGMAVEDKREEQALPSEDSQPSGRQVAGRSHPFRLWGAGRAMIRVHLPLRADGGARVKGHREEVSLSPE